MAPELTAPERAILSDRFGLLRYDGSRPSRRSLRAIDLLDRGTCEPYLDWLGSYIGSPSRRVTASTLAKRYAHLAVSPVLYTMTVYDKGLRLSLEHCVLQTFEDPSDNPSGTKLPHLRLTDCRITAPDRERRSEWRQDVVRGLFAEHLTPLLRALSEIARIPMIILWENVLVRIAPLFEDAEEASAAAGNRSAADRNRADYRFIAHECPGTLFGERRNPFSRLAGPADAEPGADSPPRMRRTCCLYYEISTEYCRSCPLPGAAGS